MLKFVLRRLVYGIFAVLGATIIVFSLSRASGDPRYLYIPAEGYALTEAQWEGLGEKLGLDRPLVVQYLIWLGRLMRGDLGTSYVDQAPVTSIIGDRLMASLKLGGAAWLFGTVIGFPLGIVAAIRRGKIVDYFARGFALMGQSLPPFWTGIVLIVIFSFQFELLPSGREGSGFAIKNLIMPAIVLGWLPAAGYLRLTRSSMLEVLDSEYIKFARAKGVSGNSVILKHALRNALLIPLTYSALLLVGFITGTVVVETVFSWPGLGQLAAQSVWKTDFPVLSIIVLLGTIAYVAVTLVLDISYALIDPRIRYD